MYPGIRLHAWGEGLVVRGQGGGGWRGSLPMAGLKVHNGDTDVESSLMEAM